MTVELDGEARPMRQFESFSPSDFETIALQTTLALHALKRSLAELMPYTAHPGVKLVCAQVVEQIAHLEAETAGLNRKGAYSGKK